MTPNDNSTAGLGRFACAAVDLAERGYHVFPLRPRGKEPLTTNGFKNATRDERQILIWWDSHPDANIGVACGASGIVAFDVDPKAGADPREVLAEFELAGGAVTRTGEAPEPDEKYPNSLAGVRGAHVIYRGRMATTDRLKVPGCEVRGEGAYIVVPPSVHPSGVEYLGELPPVGQLAPIPAWLPELVEERTNGAAPAVEEIITENRNTTLASIAGTLRRRGLGEGALLAALRGVNAEQCRPPLEDDEVARIARSVGRYAPAAPTEAKEGEDSRVTDRDTAVQIATGAELWHTPSGQAFATIEIRGHREHVPVASQRFKSWIRLAFREQRRKAPGPDAITTAQDMAAASAELEGERHEVHTRVAAHAGRVYLDLCDEDWRAVEVDRDGWRIVDSPPVRFRRSANALALPEPVQGGSLDALRAFVNAPEDDAWALMKAWLIGAMAPDGPYPLLMPFGEAGAGKSSTTRRLAGVLDPQKAATREAFRNTRDLAIQAEGCRVLAFDNLSRLTSEASDALCRLATGGGLGTRSLYTDAEEAVFYAKRPVIANGIEEVATRGDLLSRALVVQLPTLDAVRDESTLAAEWTAAHPAILGALLDATSAGLRDWSTTHLGDRAPRMADFARWVVASGAVPGFLELYAANRDESIATELDASSLATAVVDFAEEHGEWRGTATELKDALGPPPLDAVKYWPTNAKTLGDALRRHAPALRARGVSVDFRKVKGNRTVVLCARVPVASGVTQARIQEPPASPPASPPTPLRHPLRHPESGSDTGNEPWGDARDADLRHPGTSTPRKENVETDEGEESVSLRHPASPSTLLEGSRRHAAPPPEATPAHAEPEWLTTIRAVDTWWPGMDDGMPDAGLMISRPLSEFVPPGIGNVPLPAERAAAMDRAWLACVLHEAEPPAGGLPARTGCTHPDAHRSAWEGDACSRCASEAVRLGRPVTPARRSVERAA